MVLIATLVLSACPALQNPAPAPQSGADPAAAGGESVILLEDGERITGRILKQAGNYIEVQIDGSTVVGFERSRIKAIERPASPAGAEASARLAARDDWFLLHDATGASIGYLHGLVQPAADGSIRLTEEWFFSGREGATRITAVEVVDSDLLARSCFYHERVHDAGGRLAVERLRSGAVQGSELVVEERSLKNRRKVHYPFSPSSRFPIQFREELRQQPGVRVHAAVQQLFDPKTGLIRDVRASSVQRREVEFGGRPVQVREITVIEGKRTNSEWVDAAARVLRREVNGAALVAVRTTRERALRAEVSRVPAAGVDSAIAATQSGRLALWVPNPVWRVQRTAADSVTLEARLYNATATLVEMDHLASDLHLASGADAVLRWLRLSVGQKLSVKSRSGLLIRRHPAIRLDLAWETRVPGEATQWRGICHVLKVAGRFVALFCAVPRENLSSLQGDLDRLVDSLQLDPQDIAPVRRGPLSKSAR